MTPREANSGHTKWRFHSKRLVNTLRSRNSPEAVAVLKPSRNRRSAANRTDRAP